MRKKSNLMFVAGNCSRRRRFSTKRFVVWLVALFVVSELGISVFISPWFIIREIRVTGNNIVSASDVICRLGLSKRQNIFLINKKTLISRVQQNPIIIQATIDRDLPNTLIVRVNERKAEMQMITGGRVFEIDNTGVPFRVVQRRTPGVPVVVCELPVRVSLGQPMVGAPYSTARRCLRLTRKQGTFDVSEIRIDHSGLLCLNVRDGFKVILGRPDQLALKLENAARAVKKLMDVPGKIVYVNVMCAEAPAVEVAK